MYLTYGSFQFQTGEAFPTFFGQARRYNQRGRAQTLVRRLSVTGEILATTQAAITTRAGQILDALSLEGGTVTFHQDGGALTHFHLPAAGSRGVRIVENTLTMQEGKAHYATALPFSITFEAEYGISDGDNLVSWSESITKIGNGGPRRVVQELDSGQSVEQFVSTNTPVVMVQQGTGVGANGYPAFPSPAYGCDSQDFVQSYGTPRLDGVVFTDYPIRWSYRIVRTDNPALGAPFAI